MPDGSDAPPPTSWWQPQNWSLRVKLGVVVLVPVVLAVALGVLRIADQAGVANDLAKVDRVVTAQGQVSELLRQLEAEREIAAGYVAANRQGDLSRYDQQAAAVDGTAGPLDQVVHDVGVDATTAAGAEAGAALRTLADVRGQVRSSGLGAGAVIARYNDVVNPLVRLTDSLSRQIVAPEVGNLAAGVRALVVARNEASLQHSLTIAALTNPVPARQDVALVQGADARYGEAISQYQAALNRQQLDTYGQYSNSPVEATRTQLVNQLANLPDAEPIDRAVLDRTFTDLRAELDKGERGVRGELSSTGLALQNDASNSAGISSVILLLALLLAALVVVLVARVLVRSLRTLRAAALDVANRRLPESVAAIRAGSGARPTVVPVPLRTTDEVGQVARAFDAVHGQAIALASEQAALQSNVSSMFVNLSRRSQALVERQLQLIEQLESNEQDADQQ
jgi:HAMP domain-containing protein